MKNKYVFVLILLCVLSILSVAAVQIKGRMNGKENESKELVVVTSFYPVYIAALNITDGIDNVRVENLTQPSTGCLHEYQLTPQDMKLLAGADVFVVNGAGMESFLSDVTNQYEKLRLIDTSEGISLLAPSVQGVLGHGREEARNAHIWMNMDKYCEQLTNLTDQLAKLDREHAEEYRKNYDNYFEKIQELIQQKNQLMTAGHKTIIFHEAFAYFAQMLGCSVEKCIDMDDNSNLSAAQIGQVVDLVKENDVKLLFAEEGFGDQIAQAVEKETDGRVLLLDTLVRGKKDKNAYLDGMKKNLSFLEEVLK